MKKKLNILYVGSEALNLKSDCNRYDVKTCEKGFETLRETEIDLVIADRVLPEMTGKEFFGKLREKEYLFNNFFLQTFSDSENLENQIEFALKAVSEIHHLQNENETLKKEINDKLSEKRTKTSIDFDKNFDENLKINAERLKLAAQIGNIGIWDWDVKNDCLIWDDAMFNLYGIDKTEFDGTYNSWIKRIHPGDVKKASQIVKTSRKGKEEFDTEVRIITPKGVVKQIRAKGATYYDDSGEAFRMVGINMDISDLRATEKKLRESEMRLKEAQGIAKMGSWELDLTKNTLYWSDEIFRIFNLNQYQFGASYEAFVKFVHPEDRIMVDTAYKEHLRSKKNYDIDHRILLNDGSVKHVHENCHSEFSESGEPLRSIGTIQDVTRIRLTEIELEKHKNHLEELVNERTRELNRANLHLKEKTEELEMFNKTMINREMRIIELKEEINRLAESVKEDIPYPEIWNE